MSDQSNKNNAVFDKILELVTSFAADTKQNFAAANNTSVVTGIEALQAQVNDIAADVDNDSATSAPSKSTVDKLVAIYNDIVTLHNDNSSDTNKLEFFDIASVPSGAGGGATQQINAALPASQSVKKPKADKPAAERAAQGAESQALSNGWNLNQTQNKTSENVRTNLQSAAQRKAGYSQEDKEQIERLYAAIHGRKPDTQGEKHWLGVLKSNGVEAVASGMLHSPEGQEYLQKNNGDIATAAFRGALGRDPDLQGFEFWSQQDPVKAAIGIANSKEASTNLGLSHAADEKSALDAAIASTSDKLTDPIALASTSVESRPGRTISEHSPKLTVVAGNPLEDQITRLYAAVHGREPDAAGKKYWTGVLQNSSVESVVRDMLGSPEAQKRLKAEGGAVKSAFKGILGRDPDPSGLDFWSKKDPVEAVIGIANSDEALEKTATVAPSGFDIMADQPATPVQPAGDVVRGPRNTAPATGGGGRGDAGSGPQNPLSDLSNDDGLTADGATSGVQDSGSTGVPDVLQDIEGDSMATSDGSSESNGSNSGGGGIVFADNPDYPSFANDHSTPNDGGYSDTFDTGSNGNTYDHDQSATIDASTSPNTGPNSDLAPAWAGSSSNGNNTSNAWGSAPGSVEPGAFEEVARTAAPIDTSGRNEAYKAKEAAGRPQNTTYHDGPSGYTSPTGSAGNTGEPRSAVDVIRSAATDARDLESQANRGPNADLATNTWANAQKPSFNDAISSVLTDYNNQTPTYNNDGSVTTRVPNNGQIPAFDGQDAPTQKVTTQIFALHDDNSIDASRDDVQAAVDAYNQEHGTEYFIDRNGRLRMENAYGKTVNIAKAANEEIAAMVNAQDSPTITMPSGGGFTAPTTTKFEIRSGSSTQTDSYVADGQEEQKMIDSFITAANNPRKGGIYDPTESHSDTKGGGSQQEADIQNSGVSVSLGAAAGSANKQDTTTSSQGLAKTSTAPAPDPNQAKIDSLYKEILGRSADKSGGEFWKGELEKHGEAYVRRHLEASPEAIDKKAKSASLAASGATKSTGSKTSALPTKAAYTPSANNKTSLGGGVTNGLAAAAPKPSSSASGYNVGSFR